MVAHSEAGDGTGCTGGDGWAGGAKAGKGDPVVTDDAAMIKYKRGVRSRAACFGCCGVAVAFTVGAAITLRLPWLVDGWHIVPVAAKHPHLKRPRRQMSSAAIRVVLRVRFPMRRPALTGWRDKRSVYHDYSM